MAAAGKPLARVEGVHGLTLLYKMADGTKVLLRSNKKFRALIAKADGPKVEDRMNIEKQSPDFIGHSILSVKGDIECLLIPTKVATKWMRKRHAEWLKSHPDSISNLRILDFNEPEAGIFAEYLLPVAADENAEPGTTVDETIAKAKRMIAKATGKPESAITISIAY